MNRVTEARFDQHRRPSSTKPTFPPTRSSGGRTWWAHFEFTRINIEPIILRKKIEDVREAGALTSIAASGVSRSCLSPVRLSFSGRWFETEVNINTDRQRAVYRKVTQQLEQRGARRCLLVLLAAFFAMSSMCPT
jgi:hypothetical protein